MKEKAGNQDFSLGSGAISCDYGAEDQASWLGLIPLFPTSSHYTWALELLL